ncbi:MAG: alpha/beta fold hydrolase [Phycisphaerales bacterium]|nr:alpha/beta fold hydrolase [Phycisphaerae bacterium]NNF44895.1 alpha/beta fold hydrolase [Phycisphaerales bacterium]NNM27845.1 alpha/beta fold hydrolase [Phycisphaerales bacterium]
MHLRLYKATGAAITAVTRLFGIELRVSGLETLPNRPVLFLVNHFTRFETFLVPYLIYRRFRVPVRTLATHQIFRGRFARYLHAVGVISTRDPRRNRTIIGDLMTGRAKWVIYPEGGLVKTKETVRRGKLHVRRADRTAPPHTGAAVLALKAELLKERYRHAAAAGNAERTGYYRTQYDIEQPGDLHPDGTIVVPVNLTYTRLRSEDNLIHRLARRLQRGLHPHLEEELRVEGSLLLGESAVSAHFGTPIEVHDHLDRGRALARQLVGWFRRERRADLFLRRQAKRLTARTMWTVYRNTEINFDHLFCYALRVARQRELPVDELRQAILLAALELREQGDLRLHPRLRHGLVDILRTDQPGPLDDVIDLATREGVMSRQNGSYLLDRQALRADHDFHDVRLKKMVQVIANEVEPIKPAARAIERAVNLRRNQRRTKLAETIVRGDLARYARAYERWHEPGVSRPFDVGAPFLLETPGARTGVLLAHGYLACPEEVRTLAEAIHAAGVTVYAVRLDGHGTAPRELTTVSWRDWMATMRRGHAVLRTRCDRCIVGGFSFGSLLAAILAAEPGVEVDGLFTINAPLTLRHPLAPLIGTVFHCNRLLARLHRRDAAGPRRNASESPDLNYQTDYLHSLRELRRAIAACRRTLSHVTAPALILQSEADSVVAPSSATELLRRLGGPATMRWLPGRRHVVVRGPGSELVFAHVLAHVERLAASPLKVEAEPPAVVAPV